jgi:hypothetical protein
VLAQLDAPPLVIGLSLILLISSFNIGVQFLTAYLLMGILFVPLLWPAWGDWMLLAPKGLRLK